jgi:hypothetical protein
MVLRSDSQVVGLDSWLGGRYDMVSKVKIVINEQPFKDWISLNNT